VDQQTKQALKHDQFVDTTKHGLEWASENRRSVIVTSAVVLAAILVVVAGALIYNSRANQASVAFGAAMQAYQTPLASPGQQVPPGVKTYASPTERAKAVALIAAAYAVGAGALTVNAHGKLDGVVRVAVVGIDQIVPRLGVDRLIGQGLDQLSGGSGTLDRLIPGLGGAIRDTANASVTDSLKKMGEPSSIDNQPAIILPLRFSDGSIYLGMLRVGEAPPLF